MIQIIPPNILACLSSSLYLNVNDSPKKSNHLIVSQIGFVFSIFYYCLKLENIFINNYENKLKK